MDHAHGPLNRVCRKGLVLLSLEGEITLPTEAMRRSFQDAMREAQVANVVVRSISGHLTEQMQQRYSTASGHEQESAIARIIDLTRVQQRVREKGAERDSNRPPMDSKAGSIEGQHKVTG
jgi:hypothetical protein